MPVPKQRHTKSRRNRRRSHHALKPTTLTNCSHCRRLIAPHQMCPHCGYYRGRQVVDVLAKLTRRERKKHERDEQERRKEEEAVKTGA